MDDYHLDFRNDPFVDLKIRQLRAGFILELERAVRLHRRRSHLRSEIALMTGLLDDIVKGKTFAMPAVLARVESDPISVSWEVLPFKWCEL